MDDLTNHRKLEHIRILRADPESDRRMRHFDAVRLRHRALPETDLEAIDPSTEIMGKRLRFPLLISSMTGGDHELVRKINRRLAEAAEETGVAMGVGSQRVLFTHPESRDSFALRSVAPTALLFGNLGAVQLNYGFGLDQARAAVEVLEADGLYLHLNPLQEAVQPEGDTRFAGLIDRMGEVAATLGRPVIAKEVGAGVSVDDAALLRDAGVRWIDVAGAGGTSWSRIEHHRQPESDADALGLLFQDWGLPTPLALRELRAFDPGLDLIASGGIRSGLDMAKAVVLGARLAGLAQPFLEPAMQGTREVVRVIERLRREFVTTMFLLGCSTLDDLFAQDRHLLAVP